MILGVEVQGEAVDSLNGDVEALYIAQGGRAVVEQCSEAECGSSAIVDHSKNLCRVLDRLHLIAYVARREHRRLLGVFCNAQIDVGQVETQQRAMKLRLIYKLQASVASARGRNATAVAHRQSAARYCILR